MEAVGDPIKQAQVISLDAEAQKNIRNSLLSKPKSAPKKSKKIDRMHNFVNRMRFNTMFTPL